ncbi:hypothetical protein [Gallibacterium salpingitidis]|uniref:hypothetical protein n=1 Tax=Gallibacterium salpingitidis TaxID=505341 RepID=UPI00082689CA|nr:hypothetical protein [Gallibacterium salpingitidis]
MKKLIIGLIPVLFASVANAECYGTDTFSNCYDGYGNRYSVSRLGNSTYVNGYNSNTRSSWSQTSNTFGNTTYQSGYDSEGNNWSQTIQHNGNSTTYSGYDSDGNSFYRTCYRNFDGSQSCY